MNGARLAPVFRKDLVVRLRPRARLRHPLLESDGSRRLASRLPHYGIPVVAAFRRIPAQLHGLVLVHQAAHLPRRAAPALVVPAVGALGPPVRAPAPLRPAAAAAAEGNGARLLQRVRLGFRRLSGGEKLANSTFTGEIS